MHSPSRFPRALVGLAFLSVGAFAGCKDTPNASPTEPAPAAVDAVTPPTSATPAFLAPASSTCAGYRKRLAAFKAVKKQLPAGTQRAARMDAQIATLTAMAKDACS